MRRLLAALALIALAGPLVTCGPLRKATVIDACVDDPDACPPCADDDACVFMGNSCTETVTCAHQDAGLAFIEIGCSEALERRWPEDDECVCAASVCQSGLGDEW